MVKKLYLLSLIILLVFTSGCSRTEVLEKYSEMGKADDESTSSSIEETVLISEPEVVGYEAESDGVARISKEEAETLPPVNKETDEECADYVSPIDFEELWEQNDEIIAWLSIPGTNISYPICQHYEDDTYYLKHNSNKNWDINGAIFTEAEYNLSDFSDPVTVVYGHNMKSGKMFGYLEETYRDGFDGRDEAIVYLPNEELHYKLFAALPVASGHLLAGKNLYKTRNFEVFAEEILRSKELEAIIDRSVKIEEGDQLIILSTCIGNKADQRYIVVGKKVKSL